MGECTVRKGNILPRESAQCMTLLIMQLALLAYGVHAELRLPGALVSLTTPEGEDMLYRARWKEDAILLLGNWVSQVSKHAVMLHGCMPTVRMRFVWFRFVIPNLSS